MSWIGRILKSSKILSSRRASIPDGVWTKCTACMQVLYKEELSQNQEVCPKCNHHMAIGARKRLTHFLDLEGVEELAQEHVPKDPLKFKDLKRYSERLQTAAEQSGEKEALVVYKGTITGLPVVAAAFEFKFMGGSMGSAVGARFVAGIDRAIADRIPFICFCASGGARMQEGLFSLMQMARTSAAIGELKALNLPYFSILTNPTMGGVSASLATLGDLLIAEPNALIGFAGPRVIEQTVRETLPPNFQTSEFLLEKGAIDMILERKNLRSTIARLLRRLYYAHAANKA